MKRYLLLLVPVCLAGALAWADAAAPAPAAERADRLRRNLSLIDRLVDGSLTLAGEDDPLKRAGHCSELAYYLAEEVRTATGRREAPRVVELGRHLHRLLEVGVGDNLSRARGGIPRGSAEEKRLIELRDGAARLVGDLEDSVQQAVADNPQAEDLKEMEEALEAMRNGRLGVERTLKTSRPRERNPSDK
jgi:hypothetical protein